MRLLFLDFDGVLNSVKWLKTRPSKEAFAEEMNISPEQYDHDRLRWALRSIDPEAVGQLNELVGVSGARTVISSSWRTMYALSKLEWILHQRGFRHHLLGATPCKWDMPENADRRLVRGDEIHAWLSLFDPQMVRLEDIVILDDDADMVPYMDRLVQTDVEVGFTAENAARALELWR